MIAFIDQEASEKAEEIDSKVHTVFMVNRIIAQAKTLCIISFPFITVFSLTLYCLFYRK